jgi:hypothetical protein
MHLPLRASVLEHLLCTPSPQKGKNALHSRPTCPFISSNHGHIAPGPNMDCHDVISLSVVAYVASAVREAPLKGLDTALPSCKLSLPQHVPSSPLHFGIRQCKECTQTKNQAKKAPRKTSPEAANHSHPVIPTSLKSEVVALSHDSR